VPWQPAAVEFHAVASGHDEPVTPDERAPFHSWSFLSNHVLSQIPPNDEGPGFGPRPSHFSVTWRVAA